MRNTLIIIIIIIVFSYDSKWVSDVIQMRQRHGPE